MENKIIEKTEVEKQEEVKIQALDFVFQRIKEYTVIVKQFDEAIESYEVLIAVVRENKDRFKVRYIDIINQFTATKISFETQRRNIMNHQKRLEKIQNNPNKYSGKDILEALKI